MVTQALPRLLSARASFAWAGADVGTAGSRHPMSDRLTLARMSVLAAGRKCPVRRFGQLCRARARQIFP